MIKHCLKHTYCKLTGQKVSNVLDHRLNEQDILVFDQFSPRPH